MNSPFMPFLPIVAVSFILGLSGKVAGAASFPSPLSSNRARQDNPFATVTISDTASVRYWNPGPLCETTRGVQSVVGFVDLHKETNGSNNDDDGADGLSASYFFWFVEARNNADTAPLTIWLNGGPGSDSLLGLFGEIGPCKVMPDLNTTLNPYSWSEVSNLLFLSQPLGVGFSYRPSGSGGGNDATSNTNRTRTMPPIETTAKAAAAAWDVLQAFMQALPTLDPVVQTRNVHLWTESYGGHYGPAFFRHFYETNERVKNGSAPGIRLELGSLGIGNGIVDALTQFPMFPEFAVNNTYNIELVPDEVSRYMIFACHMPNGCVDQAQQCREEYLYNRASTSTIARCTEATYMCRDNVEAPYYYYGGRNIYDIRRPETDPVIPQDFVQFLNLASTRQALGIDSIPELAAVPYAWQSDEVYGAFARSGDYIYPVFLADLECLLEHGIRVILMYGDADYIANWFGGEAVSLALNYSQSLVFRETPYTPLVFDGQLLGISPENGTSNSGTGNGHGKVREQGNLSFAVIYDAGHFVPFYKPALAMEMFRRAVTNLDLPTGRGPVNSTAVPLVPDSPLPWAKTETHGSSSRPAPSSPTTAQ